DAPLITDKAPIIQPEPGRDTTADPSVEATRADPAEQREPAAATDAKPAPKAAADNPRPEPAAAEAEPAKFIRGHDRPRGQNLGNTRPGARRLAATKGVQPTDTLTEVLRQDRRGLYAQYFNLDSGDLSKLDASSP